MYEQDDEMYEQDEWPLGVEAAPWMPPAIPSPDISIENLKAFADRQFGAVIEIHATWPSEHAP